VVATGRGERLLVIPWWLRGFALDLRSLALFRIVVGLCLVGSLIRRLSEAGTFYSSVGVLPAEVLLRDRENILSLHLISDTVEIQVAIFLVALAFAIAFAAGYRTRLAAVVSWVLWLSMLARNPLATHAGDHELRLLLFWSMFLPLNGAWAMDKPPFRPLTQLSPATVALILQIGAVYWFAAAEKMGPAWLTERSAVYYALNIDMVATPLGAWVREFPAATRWITVGTIAVEFLGPFLVISPWRTGLCRIAAVLLFMGFHLGIGLTMRLGLFAWISALAWVVFLPGSVWRPRVDGRVQERSLISDAVVIASVLITAFYLMAPRPRSRDLIETSAYHQAALMLGWEQRWPMFAPRPATMDPWWSVEGITPEGRREDLWAGQTPGVKPDSWEATYRNSEWVGYMFQLLAGKPYLYEALGRYFCGEWNGHGPFGKQNPPRRLIDTVSVTFFSDPTAAPARPERAEERRLLWKGACPVPTLGMLPGQDSGAQPNNASSRAPASASPEEAESGGGVTR
jgi:hypothetical protein